MDIVLQPTGEFWDVVKCFDALRVVVRMLKMRGGAVLEAIALLAALIGHLCLLLQRSPECAKPERRPCRPWRRPDRGTGMAGPRVSVDATFHHPTHILQCVVKSQREVTCFMADWNHREAKEIAISAAAHHNLGMAVLQRRLGWWPQWLESEIFKRHSWRNLCLACRRRRHLRIGGLLRAAAQQAQ